MKNVDPDIGYFIYARKSSESEERQVTSIDAQVELLESIAKQMGFKIVDILTESKSAKNTGERPVFDEMIKRIKKGEAKGILCWKLNRLARNAVDGGMIMDLLQKTQLLHIYQAAGSSYTPEDNVLSMYVEFGMANQFIKELSVDVKRGLKKKAELGWCPYQPPFGYKNAGAIKGQKTITKNDDAFKVMRSALKEYLTGQISIAALHRKVISDWSKTDKIGKPISLSTFTLNFSNSFYYGDFEYPKGSGIYYKGKHEPMISKSEFDLIQRMLGTKNPVKTQQYDFTFKGPIKCGVCGCSITAEHKLKRTKSGKTHTYIYYHCTGNRVDPTTGLLCKQKGISIQENNLQEQISEYIKQITLPKEFITWALNIIKEEHQDIIHEQEKKQNELNRQLQRLEDEYNGYMKMRASNEITEDEFKEKRSVFLLKKQTVMDELALWADDKNNWYENLENVFNFSENIHRLFLNGTDLQKKEIVFALGSNLTVIDKKLFISLTKPLLWVSELSEMVNSIMSTIEPKNPLWEKDLVVEFPRMVEMLPR
jgi:site-specific DNA recombinase